jgi:hypothetical protein
MPKFDAYTYVTQLFFPINPRLVPYGTAPWAINIGVLPEHKFLSHYVDIADIY